MPRKYLRPEDAPNEAIRQIRDALRRMSTTQLARKLAIDPSTLRRYARGERNAGPRIRESFFRVLGTPIEAWESPPASDDYIADPEPTRPARR